jgi:hypothetical protein
MAVSDYEEPTEPDIIPWTFRILIVLIIITKKKCLINK